MARLGRRERLAKRDMYAQWRAYREEVVSRNLASEKPDQPAYVPRWDGKMQSLGVGGFKLTPDALKAGTHTPGFRSPTRLAMPERPVTKLRVTGKGKHWVFVKKPK